MKNTISSIKKKMAQKYILKDESLYSKKSTNINVLLNRVKQDQKKENQKKLLFMLATSGGLFLFGVLIF